MEKKINEKLIQMLTCPVDRTPLSFDGSAFHCISSTGHNYPVINGIPRFVQSDNYVSSFSLEWNIHNKTQLDCFRDDAVSEKEFMTKTDFSPGDLRGKLILDAGVGAGRYTDIMSRWGAEVVGVDLSYAVEAAHKSFCDRENVMIVQGDISALPFRHGTFDAIISIGVLHHTPDTFRYFSYLVPFLKPGGSIAIWVYPNEGQFRVRKKWIPFTSRIPNSLFYAWCQWFIPITHRHASNPIIEALRPLFPWSDQGLGVEYDVLDTFDGYSPRYHGIHSREEVMAWFKEVGLIEVYSPNDCNTAVRGRLPG
ncbi:MAG: methyltransferase domain-containing protein [Nitrospiraceae bacterium]|nr:methyltransferase domain-containing protein [Nitrospiraceae bacterium]